MERSGHSFMIWGLGVLCLVWGGCSSSRTVVTRPGEGGIVALRPGLFGDARLEAQKAMNSNCGDRGYNIVEEREAVVGTISQTESNGFGPFGPVTTTSKDQTEWRICYECAGVRKPWELPPVTFDSASADTPPENAPPPVPEYSPPAPFVPPQSRPNAP